MLLRTFEPDAGEVIVVAALRLVEHIPINAGGVFADVDYAG